MEQRPLRVDDKFVTILQIFLEYPKEIQLYKLLYELSMYYIPSKTIKIQVINLLPNKFFKIYSQNQKPHKNII